MKILAATPQNYTRTKYIVELNSQELVSITMFYAHANIPVTDSAGTKKDRDKEKLEAGDVIDETVSDETLKDVRVFLDDRKEIERCSTSIRASLTKLQNTLRLK